jgi:DNA-binding MarR family transcriptional regulator
MKPDASSPVRSTRSGLDVLEQLRVVVRLAGAYSARLERSTGIPGAQLWALHEIGSADGLTVGELARRQRLHQTTVSNLLNRLESRGLVRKGRAAGDRRVVQLHLTSSGRKALKNAPGPARGLLPDVLDGLSPSQLRKVHDGLAVLVERMGGLDPALAGKPMPFNE